MERLAIGKKSILVVGDIMLDTYYNGDVMRISPEAPVPVFRKKEEWNVLGGAANVAANLVAAGQDVSVLAVVGKDEAGRNLMSAFNQNDIRTDFVLTLERPTTEKIRFLANEHQQVMRLDVEDTDMLEESEYETLLVKLHDRIEDFDLILLSDYMKGLLNYDFTQAILLMAKEKGIPTVVDVKDSRVGKYKGAYLLKPNLKELCELTGMSVSDDRGIIEASGYLKTICECKYVLTTCGARGMVLVGDGEPYFIGAEGREVFDVTGAGDTAIAYLAACMMNGLSMKESVHLANIAAGIQVSKVGTSSVYWEEIRRKMLHQEDSSLHKLISGQAVNNFRKEHKSQKIVFTNGCFDIMHAGHIRYLQEAANLGDILVVGLNSDASVRRLKGPERPINNEMDRAEMMCALGFIDYVAIFEEDTPLNLIKKIEPDVLVKGGDYSGEYVIGTKETENRGGHLVLLPFVEGKSTTKIIDKIRKERT